MLLPGLVQSGTVQWQLITPVSDSTANNGYVPIVRPTGASMLYAILVGAGGAGGSGTTGAASTARSGGGGGGSGGIVTMLAPWDLLGNVIHASAGRGAVFNTGGESQISPAPSVSYTFARAPGGVGGSGVNAGAGGSTFNGPSGAIGRFYANTTGFGGSNGGTAVGGFVNVAANASIGLTGGGGGGGTSATNVDSLGGEIRASAPTVGQILFPIIVGGLTGGGAGNRGFNFGALVLGPSPLNRINFTGGSGGGAFGTGTGGNGGDGAWGCGGGGGGAGVTGGNPGKGGDGFIILGSW